MTLEIDGVVECSLGLFMSDNLNDEGYFFDEKLIDEIKKLEVGETIVYHNGCAGDTTIKRIS